MKAGSKTLYSFALLFIFVSFSPLQSTAKGLQEDSQSALLKSTNKLLSDGKHQKLINLLESKLKNQSNIVVVELPKIYRRLGEAYITIGNQKKSIENLQLGLKQSQILDNRVEAARIMTVLGNVYVRMGKYELAEKTLNQSIKAANDLNKPHISLAANNNLANLHASLGKYELAVSTYTGVIEQAKKLNNEVVSAKALLNLARANWKNKQSQIALINLNESYDISEKLSATTHKAYLLIGIGRLYSKIDKEVAEDLQEVAFKSLNQAKKLSTNLNNSRALSYSDGYLGSLYEDANRIDDALALTRQALHRAQLIKAPEIVYRWQWQTARLLNQQGKLDESIAAYQGAIDTLQPIRQALIFGSTIGDSFRERVGPVYLGLADLLLKKSTDSQDGTNKHKLLSKVRTIMESFKSAELEDYFQDDCVADLSAKTAGISQLEENTIAIYPIILDDRLEILVSLPTGIKQISVNVDSITLKREVNQFRQRLEKRTTRQYLRHSKQIYDWLIRPIENELSRYDINTLVFIPDGIFRTIPLAALHDGKEFLIKNYAIATTPSLALTDPSKMKRDNVLVMANGITEAVQNFPSLPYVKNELRDISAYHSSTILKNKQFNFANMKNTYQQKPYNIIHIASHGKIDRDIRKSFLLTYNKKLTLDNLESFISQSKFRDTPIELLTLSACQTAAGDDRAALGLAGVAVKSGAKSAMATLWFVNDEASSKLVSNFYQELTNVSLTKAKALQQAQIALIDGNQYKHPSYWAPFLLIGNWQ